MFFYFVRVFYFLKTLSKEKYEYAEIQRETLLEDAPAMAFIDFGLSRSPYCKISYLLKSADVTQIWWTLRKVLKFYKLHDSVCEDNSWIDGKFWQSFFSKRSQTF